MKPNFKHSNEFVFRMLEQKVKMLCFLMITMFFAPIYLSAQNLLLNPSFEDDFTSWSPGPNPSYFAPTIISNDGQDEDLKSVRYDEISSTTGFFQNVPVTAGQTYEISFWYKSSGDGSDARLWSIYRDSSGGAVYTTEDATTDSFRTNNEYLPTSAEWRFYSAEMLAGNGSESLDVAVRVYLGSTVSFDNFKAGIAGTMTISDLTNFADEVKMNTIVTDKLMLQLPERSTVNIYSMSGTLVISERVDNGGAIDTKYLPKGIYIVKVSNGYATVNQRIVKR